MIQMAARLRELRVAVMLLTRLPAGHMHGSVPGLTAARWGFPIVGLLAGTLCWAVHAGALMIGAPAGIAALLTLAALTLITGALHLDGLADLADGLGGGRDKAHCLDIMRDSRIGSYGVVALIVTLGLWAAALQALGDSATLGMFLAVAVISRAGMVVALDVMPPARSDGLGHMAEGHSPVAFGVAIVLSVLCLLPMGWRGLAVALAMCTVGLAVAYKAKSRIGGQTGDVLGALQMTSETAGWVALAVLFQPAG